MKKILQRESPLLREIAKDVVKEEISSSKIQKVLSEMKEALDSQDDGVAIAAPQIGYSLRIFMVSEKVENILREEKRGRKTKLEIPPETTGEPVQSRKNPLKLVFINPVIKKFSKEKMSVEEGCLSVRYLYGHVSRSKKVMIEAYDETGKKFEQSGVGLMAQIFQHETDHLNGILFIDKAKNLENIPPPHFAEREEKLAKKTAEKVRN